jgi:hypothetical protein
MKRTSLLLILPAIVGLLGTISVIAVNCGDTWQPAKADAIEQSCPGGTGRTHPITQTKYWRIFWVDGYERNDVAVADSGECYSGFFYRTYCYPEFLPPVWSQNDGGFGEWDQVTRSSRYNSLSPFKTATSRMRRTTTTSATLAEVPLTLPATSRRAGTAVARRGRYPTVRGGAVVRGPVQAARRASAATTASR